MKKNKKIGKHSMYRIFTLLLFVGVLSKGFSIYAKDGGRNLIQTTTLLEEYEARVYCDATGTSVLEVENEREASKKVLPSLVQITNNGLVGSGVIWEMQKDVIVIATNGHVLEGWDENALVRFMNPMSNQESFVSAQVVVQSEEVDVGFLVVYPWQFAWEELMWLSQVQPSVEAYQQLTGDCPIFFAGSADGVAKNRYQARVVATRWYVEEFGTEMLYCIGYAKPGMSGAGAFDLFGNMVGMVTGGDGGDKIVCIPIKQIMDAYEKCLDKLGELDIIKQ